MVDPKNIARLVISKQNLYHKIPENQIKTLFLFGAGASKGCGEIYPYSPPVGNELYLSLCNEYPESWGRIPSELDTIFLESFEMGMNALWINNTDLCYQLLKELGIFFSQFMPVRNSVNAYRKIVQKLISRNVADVNLSTLNYDCLLDGEMTNAGLQINYLFSPAGQCPLMKLHGSCNWFLDIPGINSHVSIGSNVWFDASIISLNTAEKVLDRLRGDSPFYPVFSLFTYGKPNPLGNTFLTFLQEEWRKMVASAKQIAIIGVRPYPLDTHIWQPLSSTPANIYCIGDNEAYEKWHRESNRVYETKFVGNRFNESIDDLLNILFP